MKHEYDFSKAERGKFYRKGAELRLPIYLDARLQTRLERIARKKGKDMAETSAMKKHHRVTGLHFEGDFMVLTIDDHKKRFKLSEISPVLHKASERERTTFEISPSGYGIHWPLLDEDLSIDGLLGIPHRPGKKIKT